MAHLGKSRRQPHLRHRCGVLGSESARLLRGWRLLARHRDDWRTRNDAQVVGWVAVARLGESGREPYLIHRSGGMGSAPARLLRAWCRRRHATQVVAHNRILRSSEKLVQLVI